MSKVKHKYTLQGGHNGLLQGDILSLTEEEAMSPLFKNKLTKVLKAVAVKDVKKAEKDLVLK